MRELLIESDGLRIVSYSVLFSFLHYPLLFVALFNFHQTQITPHATSTPNQSAATSSGSATRPKIGCVSSSKTEYTSPATPVQISRRLKQPQRPIAIHRVQNNSTVHQNNTPAWITKSIRLIGP